MFVFLCNVFLVTYMSELTAAHSDVPSRKTLIQWDATRTPSMLFFPFLTSVCLCRHLPPMTQGQGESKVKLHIMNLAAARSPLADMGFV